MSPADPFVLHFEQELSVGEVEELTEVFSQPLQYQHSLVGTHGEHALKIVASRLSHTNMYRKSYQENKLLPTN